MLGWILLLLWLVATEIAYFGFFREDLDDFGNEKFISMMFGFIIAFVGLGFPWIISIITVVDADAPIGWIVFPWYYGIIGSIALFFGSNYWISCKLDAKEKAEKKAKAKLKKKSKKK